MGELITTMFSGVSETVTGLATAVKDMFLELLYDTTIVEGMETQTLSEFSKFSFLLMGVSLALGLGYFIIRKIRA